MPRIGTTRSERVLSKWIAISASVVAVVAVIMFLCFRFIGPAHAEPGVLSGAGSHKASGHVEIVKDGAVTKVFLKDDFSLQEAPAPRLAWGNNGYKRRHVRHARQIQGRG